MNIEGKTPLDDLKGVIHPDIITRVARAEEHVTKQRESIREQGFENLGKAFLYIDMIHTLSELARAAANKSDIHELDYITNCLENILLTANEGREVAEGLKLNRNIGGNDSSRVAVGKLASTLDNVVRGYEDGGEECAIVSQEKIEKIKELLSTYAHNV